jgi:hypothetical protein
VECETQGVGAVCRPRKRGRSAPYRELRIQSTTRREDRRAPIKKRPLAQGHRAQLRTISNLRIFAIPHNEIDRERFQYREPRDHSARVSHSLRARRADIATAPRL